MLTALVYLAIFAIAMSLAWWLINQVALPPPAKQFVTIAFVVIIALFVIYMLLNFAHGGRVTPLY